MQTYSEYKPTQFDLAGLSLPDKQKWLVVPCGQNRDSGILDQSNFKAALDMLGGESDTVEVHRFGHWACGWFEIIIAAPELAGQVEQIEARLEEYPVLDGDAHSEMETEAILEAWENMGMRERIEFAVENGHPMFAARRGVFDCDNDCGDAVYRLIRQ